jgi:plasmid stabilization system protein ParE
MSFSVRLLPRAKLQLGNAALWWAENRSTEQAAQWINKFEAALQLLGNNAEKRPLAPECDSIPFEVREMKFGLRRSKTHRAAFEIRRQEVLVYAIRHLAQDSLIPDDFENREK